MPRYILAATPWSDGAGPGELRRLGEAIRAAGACSVSWADTLPVEASGDEVILADAGDRPVPRLAVLAPSLRRRLIVLGVLRAELGRLAREITPMAAIEYDTLRRWINTESGPPDIFAPLAVGSPFKMFHGPRDSTYAQLRGSAQSLPQLIVDYAVWRQSAVKSA